MKTQTKNSFSYQNKKHHFINGSFGFLKARQTLPPAPPRLPQRETKNFSAFCRVLILVYGSTQ